jgi:hypothetical protein
MGADLAFHIKCEHRAGLEFERQASEALEAHGFRVLNVEAIRRVHGQGFYDVDIVAIDQENREITIKAFPDIPGFQAVGLYTRPPTQHDVGIENALLNFGGNLPGCHTEQVSRSENPAAALAMYEWEIRRVDSLFMEAKELSADGSQQEVRASLESTRGASNPSLQRTATRPLN